MNIELSSDLRREVVALAAKCFNEENPKKEFVAGDSYIPVTIKSVCEQDLAYLIDASLDMWLTAGRYGREFEKEISSYFGKKLKGLLVNSGSSANLVATSALGSPMLKGTSKEPMKPGDEVLTVAAGFPTTVNPILQNNWKPVFVDVDLDTFNVTLDRLQEAKTDKTKAVIVAHTLGNPFRADLISEWCKDNGMYLIEDSCDAFGAEIAGEKAGSFGDFATTSFYPAHHITMGEGGAVMAKSGPLRRAAESIRDWGRDCWCEPGVDNSCKKRFDWKLGELPEGYDHKYVYSQLGYNLKVTDMQAAVGISQLKKSGAFVAARRKNYDYLYAGIKNSPILSDKVGVMEATENTNPSWFGFPIRLQQGINRMRVQSAMEESRIGTRLMFAGNLTKQPAYQGHDFRIHGELKNTDAIMNQVFWMGVHPLLTPKMMDYMLETLERIVKEQ